MPSNLFQRDAQYDDDGNLMTGSIIESASRTKTQIAVEDALAAAGTSTMYTVPAGKVFYLVSVQLWTIGNNASTNTYSRLESNAAKGMQFITHNLPVSSNVISIQTNFSYAMPIRFTAGETIQIRIDQSGVYNSANITGWLEDA